MGRAWEVWFRGRLSEEIEIKYWYSKFQFRFLSGTGLRHRLNAELRFTQIYPKYMGTQLWITSKKHVYSCNEFGLLPH